MILKNNLLYDFDKTFQNQYENVIGCDEVGRGSLAGPIVVCCLSLNKNFINNEIKDSKKLSERKRNLLKSSIINNSKEIHYAFIDNNDIDKFNPLEATKIATKKCLEQFIINKDFVIFDYLSKFFYKKSPFLNLKQGDSKSLTVASASILAKIKRDDYIKNLSLIYPFYHFDKNKGYGTLEHFNALEIYGPCKIHRVSYNLIKNK